MEHASEHKSRRSICLTGYDYSNVGMYFVTICAVRGEHILGSVRGKEVLLNPIGEIVQTVWIEIPRHFSNTTLETHVVMPNHIHGILHIQSKLPGAINPAGHGDTLQRFGKPIPGSIPTIVRSFKSAASKRARESGLAIGESIWQRGYFEHIVRNTDEYVEIANYIRLNPVRWEIEKNNPITNWVRTNTSL